jgi:hypothetical protein
MDLKEAYRALDPAHPLDPESPFYVSRPDNPVSRIIAEFKMTDTPRQYLLTGHRGTGKTTELNRIERALETDYLIRSVVVGSPNASLLNAVLTADIPGVESELPATLEKILVHRQFNFTSDNRPILLLIDGIDKAAMRDIDDHYFSGLFELRRMSLHVVCVIPLTLPLTEHFGDIAQSADAWHFLPAIDLWTRDGEPITEGWEMCRDVIRWRADMFSEKALNILIQNGAGVHRELLRLAQRACVFAAVGGRGKVGEEDASRAVQDARNEYSLLLRSEDFDLLRRVERTGQISGDPKLLRLVRDQLIVAYGGGSTWFAVHPIVEQLLPGTRKVASR